MSCACEKKENKEYLLVYGIAEKLADKEKTCYVLFRLECGNYDFELLEKFKRGGKTEVEYIIPL